MLNWFGSLFKQRSHLLLGGFHLTETRASLLLRTFWANFQQSFGDHAVFLHKEGELDRCVPYYLHLDEGTGLRTGILCPLLKAHANFIAY